MVRFALVFIKRATKAVNSHIPITHSRTTVARVLFLIPAGYVMGISGIVKGFPQSPLSPTNKAPFYVIFPQISQFNKILLHLYQLKIFKR